MFQRKNSLFASEIKLLICVGAASAKNSILVGSGEVSMVAVCLDVVVFLAGFASLAIVEFVCEFFSMPEELADSGIVLFCSIKRLDSW